MGEEDNYAKTSTPRTSSGVRSDQDSDTDPAVATKAPQKAQKGESEKMVTPVAEAGRAKAARPIARGAEPVDNHEPDKDETGRAPPQKLVRASHARPCPASRAARRRGGRQSLRSQFAPARPGRPASMPQSQDIPGNSARTHGKAYDFVQTGEYFGDRSCAATSSSSHASRLVHT